jgi:hypothetical protein
MKYKFVETQGCTAFSFTINDKELNDISKDKQKEIVDYLCEKMKEGLDDGTVMFSDIVRAFQTSDYGMEESSCDQCGDRIHWDIWEI